MTENNLRLLVADDHRMFIEGLRYILKEELQIEIAGFAINGKDAIDMCRNGDYDVILMDINMPLVDGIYATAEIKNKNPGIKIIILSMLTDLGTLSKALKAGADAYIIKNTGPDEIKKALQALKKNEIYISDTIIPTLSGKEVTALKTKSDYLKFSENLITPREQGILKLIVEGYTDTQIADILFISDKTVSTHRKNMLAKLNLPNTAALVKFALENNLV